MDIITDILEPAKEILLQHGYHRPCLFIERNNEVALCPLSTLPDQTFDKQKLLFAIGRAYGQEHPGVAVEHVCLVTEMRTSIQPLDEKLKYERPSDDPDRKEALGVLHLEMKTMKSVLYTMEILRAGNTLDLVKQFEREEIRDNLLPYFIAGFSSAKLSDAELARMIEKHTKS